MTKIHVTSTNVRFVLLLSKDAGLSVLGRTTIRSHELAGRTSVPSSDTGSTTQTHNLSPEAVVSPTESGSVSISVSLLTLPDLQEVVLYRFRVWVWTGNISSLHFSVSIFTLEDPCPTFVSWATTPSTAPTLLLLLVGKGPKREPDESDSTFRPLRVKQNPLQYPNPFFRDGTRGKKVPEGGRPKRSGQPAV